MTPTLAGSREIESVAEIVTPRHGLSPLFGGGRGGGGTSPPLTKSDCTVIAPMGRLLLLFIVVPVIELVLLIEIGQRVGTLTTIGLITGTGIVGASLARQQGINTLARLQKDLDGGRLPAEAIVDGVLILVAAALLITPGVLTDVFGFFCLVPSCRRLLTRSLKRRFERAVRAGTVNVTAASTGAAPTAQPPPMKNVTPRRPGTKSTEH